jgi:S1-C subfamily serine protease
LIRELAARDMIRPLMTQGSVTDLYKGRVVNDAATGEGGSGAPLFGRRGRVVAVTFAVFTESDASNFAAPASQAVRLLRLSGWTQDR